MDSDEMGAIFTKFDEMWGKYALFLLITRANEDLNALGSLSNALQ